MNSSGGRLLNKILGEMLPKFFTTPKTMRFECILPDELSSNIENKENPRREGAVIHCLAPRFWGRHAKESVAFTYLHLILFMFLYP